MAHFLAKIIIIVFRFFHDNQYKRLFYAMALLTSIHNIRFHGERRQIVSNFYTDYMWYMYVKSEEKNNLQEI